MNRLNTFQLKIIAVVIMVIDHIGCYLILRDTEIYVLLRIIGRLSAPIFWYCFVTGFRYSRRKVDYTKRLFVAGLIMGAGNILLNILTYGESGGTFMHPNMFLSLGLAAILIQCIEYTKSNHVKNRLRSIISLCIGIAAFLFIGFKAEYGWYAAIIIPGMYFINNMFLNSILIIGTGIALSAITGNVLQLFMIVSILFMNMDNHCKPENQGKIFFYLFYPLHIWVLASIAYLCC